MTQQFRVFWFCRVSEILALYPCKKNSQLPVTLAPEHPVPLISQDTWTCIHIPIHTHIYVQVTKNKIFLAAFRLILVN